MLRNLSEKSIVALGFLVALLPLLGFWLTGLTDLDEGYYGAVIAEMNRRGEWVTPYFNGKPWFEKPILLYWISKPWIGTFGPRFGVVLCAGLLYGLVFRFMRKHFGLTAGLGTMLVLASNLYMVLYGRMLMTDVPLTLAFWIMLTGIYDGLLGEEKGWLWAGFGLGLSILAKGPVGLLLLGGWALWTWWRRADQRPLLVRGAPVVLVIGLLVTALWYVPCYLDNRDTFVQKFLIEQNLQRFQGGDVAHAVPFPLGPIYYLVLIFVGFAPWVMSLRAAWPGLLDQSERAQQLRFFTRWALVVVLFFTISAAKLPHYVLPALPALAVLVGIHLFAGERSGESNVIDALQPDILRKPALLSALFFILVNAGMMYWDASSGNRFLREMVLAAKGKSLAVFQLSRRTADLGTGKAQLMETSHPSIAYYLDAPYEDTDTWDELDRSPAAWVLTRPDRISDADALSHHLVVSKKSDFYVLFQRTDRTD